MEMASSTLAVNELIEDLVKDSDPTALDAVRVMRSPEILPGNPVFLVVGPSGSGKTTFANFLVESGIAKKVQTATTRNRKVERGESEGAYLWMDKNIYDSDGKVIGEKNAEQLIEEYGLLECVNYAGNYYGLPEANLDDALTSGPCVIACENDGVRSISEHLKGKNTVVAILILPERMEDLFERMVGRDNREERIAEAVEELEDFKKLANYLILNNKVSPELAENLQIPALSDFSNLVKEIIKRCQEIGVSG